MTFNHLTRVIIKGRQWQVQRHLATPPPSPEALEINSRLQKQLWRIFQWDGARELIEQAQQQALTDLEQTEKRFKKDQKPHLLLSYPLFFYACK